MDLLATGALYSLLIPIIGACIALLLLYGVIRVAVARGLRDHYLWLERNRPNGSGTSRGETIGQYDS